ncbi:MAG: hypothetical protein IKH56_05005 [Oscillospiraceae bacterium]|nr:hypothetical protein [Oscillospiraceae bacterium]
MTDPTPKVYRKRRGPGIALRVLAAVVAGLMLLAVLVFFGLRRHIAYTDSGRLYLDIPWLYGYMNGPPEDDPLSSELTLTGDSYRAAPAPSELSEPEAEAIPDPSPAENEEGTDGAVPEETPAPSEDVSAPEG